MLLKIFALFLVDDDDEEEFVRLLLEEARENVEKECGLLLNFLERHPGRGNFIRGPDHYRLVCEVPNYSRFEWHDGVRLNHFEGHIGIPLPVFENLASLIAPWMALPRRCSKNFFQNFSESNFELKSYDYYYDREMVPRKSGRGYSQSPLDRFLHYFLALRYPGTLYSHLPTQKFSLGTIWLDFQHGTWATFHALEHAESVKWLEPGEEDEIWAAVPEHIRGAFLDKVPLCVDVSFRPLPNGIPPFNKCDYYSAKPGVNAHVFGNLLICDLFGRPRFVRTGGTALFGELALLRSSRVALDFEEHFPADSDFKILADGLFRGVGCGIDERLVLPYREPLEGPHEIAFNKFVAYLRSVVENVFGCVDRLFPIVPHPPKYAWFVQPIVTHVCFSLYSAVRSETGFIATERLERLKGDFTLEDVTQVALPSGQQDN